ncbi:MAG TPA: type IV pilin protein [Rhodanobacteraceae bacterium]|nr:type IV pilin protein [Rhodanobacteraceae bacterium]
MKRRAIGFSLIELMIVVAVVAMLATIAFPSYSHYMMQMHRTQAQSYLMQIAQRQQQYFLDSRAFASSSTMLGLAPVPAVVAAQYVVTIGPAVPTTPPTFIASAAPRAGSLQAKYREPTLSIAQDGTKSPPGVW